MSIPTVQAATYQGRYAGSVSRFVAYVIDLAVTTAVFALGLAAISYGVHIVTGHQVNWNRSNIVVAILFVAWQFLYFGYSWAVSGRTFGMAVLGICVVRADGSVLAPRQGVVRSLVFPLSFLFFGLGFLGILVQREHRALHDLIAGSAVIYAWDARAARLRFLARQAQVAIGESPPPGAAPAPPALDLDRELVDVVGRMPGLLVHPLHRLLRAPRAAAADDRVHPPVPLRPAAPLGLPGQHEFVVDERVHDGLLGLASIPRMRLRP